MARVLLTAMTLMLVGEAAGAAAASGGLRVSENGRFLVIEDGQPFFYVGDTAWELFHRLNREEAEHYLRDRAGKGFTVIQAVALAEFDGLESHNAYGEVPLIEGDPTRPNERYFEHVDWVVDTAERLGLYIGMLPTWGDKWNRKWGVGPEVFTPENAEAYGEWLGRRYRDKPIIWILGGDRNPEIEEHLAIVRAMARGLRRGDGGRHLMTFHPQGGASSSRWFHDDDWLDFNMLQSGHSRRNTPNHEMIAADYARTPVKPCLDGEPCYENHPVNWNPTLGRFGDHDVRKAAYWAVFAGAHGHTYGCHEIWQFYAPERPPISHAMTPWREALQLPGAGQMRHLRALMESRPFLSRIPDQALIVPDAPPEPALTHLLYTRDAGGSAVFYVNGRVRNRGIVAGTLENWDRGSRLALANELTRERPWLGEYRLVAIYDRALSAAEAAARFAAGPAAAPEDAAAAYLFQEQAGTVVRDESGGGLDLTIADPEAVEWLPGGGLAVRSPTLIAAGEAPAELMSRIVASGAITIEAWVKPADHHQAGPARIVTLSRDTVQRNFTLGQEGGDYEVRLRTTQTSDNGLPGLATTDREARHVQATRDGDGSYAMVYLPEAGQRVTLDTSALSGERLRAWWYDPRTGQATALEGDFPVGGRLEFTSPEQGPDWVLVLDDAARGYPPPGRSG